MAKQVSWRWVAGAVCPHCGSAVQWHTETVPDRRAPSGFAEVKSAIGVTLDKAECEADIPVHLTVSMRGHEETVKTVFRHMLDAYCPSCNLMLSSYSLVPGEPREYPAGYWVEAQR